MNQNKSNVLLIKQGFIPGPTFFKSSYFNNNLTNSVRSSYTILNDRFKSSDFLFFPLNQTLFVSLSNDYPITMENITNNSTIINSPILPSSLKFIPLLIGIILFTITIWTIIGNILVILAFLFDKQIRQGGMSNYLIINLAVSDLLLGIAVLPLSASYSTLKLWYFGRFLCEMWLAIDVLCSTASIWGLLMIACDRYIATNHPIRYRHHRHSIRIALIYVFVAWFVSIAISLLPALFFEKKTTVKYSASEKQCDLYKDLKFVVTSSILSFYFPLIIMIFLYAKVLYAIRQQSTKMNRKRQTSSSIKQNNVKDTEYQKTQTLAKNQENNNNNDIIIEYQRKTNETTLSQSKILDSTSKLNFCPQITIGIDDHQEYYQNNKRSNYFKLFTRPSMKSFMFCCSSQSSLITTTADQELIQNGEQSPSGNTPNHYFRLPRRDSDTQHQQRRREMTQEARVTRSLAVVIGCFICCWLPFFTLYITRAACNCLSFDAIEFFVWLGYSNSSLNPVLYAILNKNFRLAFKNIIMSIQKLCCRFKVSY
ncbi:unnamed protein product [Didymodactylos carnosus]|uniref:G-protein coupled receptors family 1 profile domain-containing protein n=1 Tax=Didymodactylos carnosus TaxID=1234261 RepID=A0A814MUZ8_9BILA|nr:unnamed protein product [Didymodactylos carnosus]CAF1083399.1 unnamed protein product [Didymodactylos carnosus]CAF3605154.1 unnamed protein product [Didymodactylos carnosus]CAF3849114.1 unnamed protein product [Didymodactylos carnosus]